MSSGRSMCSTRRGRSNDTKTKRGQGTPHAAMTAGGMVSHLEVMALQAATLYRQDGAGRLLTVNEPGDEPASRLFVGRTNEGNLWRFRSDLPPALVRELEGIL